MTGLRIQTTDGGTSFRPGQDIAGTIWWSLAEPPDLIELSLFWTTRGKGSVDSQVIESLRLDGPPADGQRPFRFRLPDLPYSFSGKLVSLTWALLLAAQPSDEQARLNIVVSPTGQEINLVSPGG
jgi:hypothetical protein